MNDPQDFQASGNSPSGMNASGTQAAADLAAPNSIDWATVFDQHCHWLRTVVLARVGERQAIEEVMQELSLAAVQQRAPISNPSSLPGWLYRLAVRKSLLYRRSRGRQRKLADRYAQHHRDVTGHVPAADPLSWLIEEERREQIRAALERLARRDREILLLKYTEDWSYRELAEHLGISESAVEARLHRARQRLRSELTSFAVIEV